ncbi:saccharopine dehydrogenase NADP-binding domain-containing protein [Amylibacter sp.]|nr:saccharopine dehydrogenase NADP-binding domain-containing protein [Amylibacter sp.]
MGNKVMTERPFDIVLYGASGFTGQLVAEYLASAHTDLQWAIAGRNQQKLERCRRELGEPDLPILIADSDDATQLKAMALQAKVIISTVGPYARHGSLLLETCAREGTHYCDLTGEAQWMAAVYASVDPLAKASGARLVHCCGFDSIPSDLSVYFLQKQFKERYGRYASRVSGRMGRASGGVSGGTVASLMLVAEQASQDPVIRARIMDPYALYPAGVAPGSDKPDQTGVAWDEDFDSWTAPFVMAAINTKVVRRSHALAGLPYGDQFNYDESQLCDSRAKALLSAGGLGTVMAGTFFAPTRALLKKLLPDPGEGPNESKRENGFFEFWTHGSDGNDHLRVKVTGQRDPGYGATSRMLAQAALCLAQDSLSVGGGIWTPASAMGDALLQRLPGVDIHFKVVED